MIKRREFLISAAATLLVASLPTSNKYEANNVNWEDVLNRVIGDRNAIISGMIKTHHRYKKWSPEWCMGEALNECGLLGESEVVHV
jgi:hypothetical protein